MKNETTIKKLGLFACIATGVGSIIGSGIFGSLPAEINEVGPLIVPAIAVATVYILMVIIPILYITSIIPASGSFVLWSSKLIHPNAGILMALINLLQPVQIAVYVVLFSDYIGAVFPAIRGKEVVVSIAVILLFGAIAYFGNYVFASINEVIVIVLLIACGIFVITGMPGLDTKQIAIDNLLSSGFKLNSMAVAVSIFSQCLSGGATITQISDDVKNPERNIPRGAIISTLVVSVIYILMALVTIGHSNGGQIDTLSDVATGYMPHGLLVFFIFCGPIFGVLTSIPPSMMYQIAVIKAVVDSEMLPKFLSRTNKHGIPVFILAYVVVLASVCVMTGSTFLLLMTVVSALHVLMDVLVCILPFKLKKKYPHACNHPGINLNHRFVLFDSMIATCLAVYLAFETFKSIERNALILMVSYVIVVFVFLIIRIRYLRSQGIDLMSDLRAPYQPWEEHEEKCRQLDLNEK